MSLKIIRCKESYIDSFCDILNGDGYSLSSLKAGLNNGFKGNVLVVSSHVNLGPNLICFGCIFYWNSISLLEDLLFSSVIRVRQCYSICKLV